MSEPNSLYVRIKISEEKLQQFFRQKPSVQPVDANWHAWWDSREMYAKQKLEHIPIYGIENNRKLLDELLNDKDFGCMEEYDSVSGSWTFTSIFFSENYRELLPMLAMLKDLATYQDEGDAGIALIYDYLWGTDAIMAYMEFLNQNALIKAYTSTTQIDSSVLYVANKCLEKAVDTFNKRIAGKA